MNEIRVNCDNYATHRCKFLLGIVSTVPNKNFIQDTKLVRVLQSNRIAFSNLSLIKQMISNDKNECFTKLIKWEIYLYHLVLFNWFTQYLIQILINLFICNVEIDIVFQVF